MRAAILDPFSGIAGDMTLGALVGLGLDPEWLKALPGRLSLTGVTVSVRQVMRAGIACWKVDFEIPPQPHGRHLKEIRRIVAESEAPPSVKERADAAFSAIAEVEGEMHGVSPERVHLHEVGAVDAILDVVGSVWGFELLAIEQVYCTAISLGDGTVRAAHGVLPVPAPATLQLLEGHRVRPGPEGAGELVTPTGAALVRVLSRGAPPSDYVPLRTGYGAGTKEFADRANALRITIIEAPAESDGTRSELVEVVTDLDDMAGESLAGAVDRIRNAGALDVFLIPTIMKRGRPGVRLEVLCTPELASEIEEVILTETTAIGLRRRRVNRLALPRTTELVEVDGHQLRIKVVTTPDGNRRRKPEFSDVERVALATGRTLQDIIRLALASQER
jgi:uncharacterized protein (TIGR00299 family) protein